MADQKKMKVLDVMTKSPVVVGPNETIDKCAKKMIKNKVGSLVVEESKFVKGILTEWDLVNKVIAKSKDAKKTKASEIMSKIPVSIKPDADILEAMKLMNLKKVRRLPVVNNGKLVGLLTIRDILKVQPELINLRLDNWSLREEKNKPSRFFEGECEECGNFTLLERVGYNVLCDECKHEKYF